MSNYFTTDTKKAIPITPLHVDELKGWLAKQSGPQAKWIASWVRTHAFTAKVDSVLVIPSEQGGVDRVLAGVDASPHIWSLAGLPLLIPAGNYKIDGKFTAQQYSDMALGFALGQYQFDKYRTIEKKKFTLALPKTVDSNALAATLDAMILVRDLINTAPEEMGPEALAKAAQDVAKKSGATFEQIVGDALLKQNYPAIHAVGRAGPQKPRLIRLRWGKANHPLVSLVGKGVTFDTGGLDLKPLSAMRLMKKDMGGAALMLGLAQKIIAAKLPIRLEVLIPAVENSIAGDAFRPSDVVKTRKGLTVEIGSTDAEGRVILADALYEADRQKPALIIDVATLTGAARTALGAELPALFSNRDGIAKKIQDAGMKLRDPLWQLPLWQGYAKYVNNQVADITNSPNYPFAGAITAALFLERFVSPDTEWVHIDSYAWNMEAQPGRPIGGEALCLRALFSYLNERFT
jgi:leucyl aminopeptidase